MSVAGLEESADSVDRKPLPARVGEDARVAHPDEPTGGSDPEAAFAILDHGPDAGARQPFGDAHRFGAPSSPAGKPAVGADPEASVAVAVQGADEIARQTVTGRHRAHDDAVAPESQ